MPFYFRKLYSIPKDESVGSQTWSEGAFSLRCRSLLLKTPSPHRLNVLGYRIGTRVLELMVWRAEGQSKAPKREIRFLPALMSIHTQVWRAVFGKPADAIEKSVEHDDECKSST